MFRRSTDVFRTQSPRLLTRLLPEVSLKTGQSNSRYGISSTTSSGTKIDIEKSEVNAESLETKSHQGSIAQALHDESDLSPSHTELKIERDTDCSSRNIYQINASLKDNEKIASEHELFEEFEENANFSYSASGGNQNVVTSHAYGHQVTEIKNALAPRLNPVEISPHLEIYETEDKAARLIFRPTSGKDKRTGEVLEVHSQTQTSHTSSFAALNKKTGDVEEKTVSGPKHKIHTSKPHI